RSRRIGRSRWVKANLAAPAFFPMAVSGIDAIDQTVRDFDAAGLTEPVFLELLACPGGCINGPMMQARGALARKRRDLVVAVAYHDEKKLRVPQAPIPLDPGAGIDSDSTFPEEQVRATLRAIGKNSERDELNCGGCGYDSCRDFCRGLLAGKAEKAMCVSYMRQLAHRKANALIQAMPSGVVIVDRDLTIVECNRGFARLMGDDCAAVYATAGSLEGAQLARVMPFAGWCEEVLQGAPDIAARQIRHHAAILSISVFTIEPGWLVGAVVQDVTEPAVQKQEIVRKAQAVIERNLGTVQQIACLLGENAAESEMLLQSVIESFDLPDTGTER
ncbi:MAG TPA: (Fe-S)-binding protein, partial [bacterium]|nr:(Fe-S)-binding protein [bacterium]